MNLRETEFYQQVIRHGRVSLSDIRSQGDALRAALYINKACDLATIYEIEGFPLIKIAARGNEIGPQVVLEPLYELENFLNTIYSRNFFVLEPAAAGSYISLDDDWRAKASTYVSYIRDVVGKADVPLDLREAIYKRLERLQSEINRERTRVDAAVSTMIEITDAIGKGAENLEPAARLIKKVVEAFGGVWKDAQVSSQPKLPAPETLGLPDLSEGESGKI